MSNVIIAKKSDIDLVAGRLAYLGDFARKMPPSWDGAKVSVPVIGPHGENEYVGRMLPGKGLYLEIDPHYVGIEKPIPFVYPKSWVQKIKDVVKSDRFAVQAASMVLAATLAKHRLPPYLAGMISTYDGIINARANANAYDVTISKPSLTTVANAWSSMMNLAGLPAAFSFTNIPSGAVPTNSSTGSWSFGISNPTGANKAYLLTFGYTAAQAINMGILVDLLLDAGNISATVSTSQTVNSTALTRYTSGAGVLMTFEVTTQIGTTASNLTVTYTNQGSVGSRSTGAQAMTTSMIVGRLLPVTLGPYIPLQSGDYGVKSVQSAQLSAAMSAGVFALELYFPLAFVPGLAANAYIERDSTNQIDGLIQLQQDGSSNLGCLGMYVLANTTSTGILTAFIRTCQG